MPTHYRHHSQPQWTDTPTRKEKRRFSTLLSTTLLTLLPKRKRVQDCQDPAAGAASSEPLNKRQCLQPRSLQQNEQLQSENRQQRKFMKRFQARVEEKNKRWSEIEEGKRKKFEELLKGEESIRWSLTPELCGGKN
ncbi:uncharacterized protein VTP21DRAFT_8185 [Calcarisporiella thermophila]|uniref:uncharacterized protein n=1 Tax=Calcarisporiella thermophila TaxID=911321 RepID=UPI00374306C6